MAQITTLAVILICILPVGVARKSTAVADIMIKTRFKVSEHSIGGDHFPAVESSSTMWFSDSTARIDFPMGLTTLFNLKKNQYATVFHDSKIVQLNQDMDLLLPSDSVSGQRSNLSQFPLGKMVSIAPLHLDTTDEWRTILGYKCRKYILTTFIEDGKHVTEIWTTKIPNLNPELAFYIITGGTHLYREFDDRTQVYHQLDGYPLYAVKTFPDNADKAMAIDEVVEVKVVKTEPGFYELPSGYRIIE